MAAITIGRQRPGPEPGTPESRNGPTRNPSISQVRPGRHGTARRLSRLMVTSLVAAALVLPLAEGTQTAEAGKKFKTVTKTFSSNGQIEIPDAGTEGAGDPYPSTITVDVFEKYKKAKVTDVNLTLRGFSHTFPDNVDVMLALGNRRATVMSDVGDNDEVNALNLTLDDQAGSALPNTSALAGGTFRPTNETGWLEANPADDPFVAPAPVSNSNDALSTFNGARPDGDWRLFVLDDFNLDDGAFAGGWKLEITAKVKKDTKKKDKKDKEP